MTARKFPSPLDHLLRMPLYAETVFVGEETWKIVDLFYFGGTYDSFCTKCGKDSTFQVIAPDVPTAFTRNLHRERMIKEHGSTPELPKFEVDVYRVHAKCTREHSHTQDFLFFLDRRLGADETGKRHLEWVMQKIGQQPSFGDVHISKVKKYASILEKTQLRELNRAIGLASHDVGVGSYVYLRRVFEALIEEAYVQAKSDKGWDDEEYARARMAERITLLRNHLPTFLVQHPEMYSLLSKGVHELSEEDCLTHFESLRIGIELILDEKLERKEREKKIREAQAALTKAVGATKA